MAQSMRAAGESRAPQSDEPHRLHRYFEEGGVVATAENSASIADSEASPFPQTNDGMVQWLEDATKTFTNDVQMRCYIDESKRSHPSRLNLFRNKLLKGFLAQSQGDTSKQGTRWLYDEYQNEIVFDSAVAQTGAACVVQAGVRGNQAREETRKERFREEEASGARINAALRGCHDRTQQQSARVIQGAVRSSLVRGEVSSMLEAGREDSAAVIQAAVRGHEARLNNRDKETTWALPLLDRNTPYTWRVNRIVDALQREGGTPQSCQVLLSGLIGEHVPLQHRDVSSFLEMTNPERADMLTRVCSKAQIDAYYAVIFAEEAAAETRREAEIHSNAKEVERVSKMASFLESNLPDTAKVAKVCESLHLQANAEVNLLEMKTMLSKLLQVEIEDVLDQDVIALTRLTKNQLAEKLARTVSKLQVDAYVESYCDLPKVAVASPAQMALHREAAEMAGVDVNWLPNAALVQNVVRWIFGLLQQDGFVHKTSLTVACKLFDYHIKTADLQRSLEAVSIPPEMQLVPERSLYHWLVFMFCECTEEEFLSGANEFGKAAQQVKGDLDPRSMFGAGKTPMRLRGGTQLNTS